MKHKFMLGVFSGISALALAVPILAQVSSAEVSSGTTTEASSTGTNMFFHRPDTTQEGVQVRIDRDTAFLAYIDAAVAVQKSATQAHKDALTAAATLTDDTQRQEAVRAADELFRTTIEAAITANPDLKSALHFGGKGHGMRGHGGPGHGPSMADLATKLGMDEDEVEAALDSGKTIEELAEEKGIELPARPKFPFMGGRDEAAPVQ